MKWLRAFIRRHTRPLTVDKALSGKEKFAIAYFLAALTAFTIVGYEISQGRNDWASYYGYKTAEDLALSPGQSMAKSLNIKRSHIVKISGLKKVSDEEYVLEDTEDNKEA